MRRVAGAAILILALGGPKWVAWVSTRHAVVPASSAFGVSASEPAHDSSSAATPDVSQARLRRVELAPPSFHHDPLRFLSSAPADSLELLPGVGPVLATRLVDARREFGSFRSWDDVDRVRGIGPKTIERLQAMAIRR